MLKDIIKPHNRRYRRKKTPQSYCVRFNMLSAADKDLAISQEPLPEYDLPERRKAKKEKI